MIKTILFDLDGTLLPMNQDEFVNAYLTLLSKKAAQYGYEPTTLVKTVWKGTSKMIANDGNSSNEEVFWRTFSEIYGKEKLEDKYIFDEFYLNEFQDVSKSCGYSPCAREIINKVKQKGYKIILATNPIFPSIATESRMKWAGISPSDFELYTTYENSRYSKPNLKYYKDILDKINCKPEECLMIGNDVNEDMIVKELGMDTFLLTECLINKDNKDINEYKNGNYKDLLDYIDSI